MFAWVGDAVGVEVQRPQCPVQRQPLCWVVDVWTTIYHSLSLAITLYHPLSLPITLYHSLSLAITRYHPLLLAMSLYSSLSLSIALYHSPFSLYQG